MPVWSLLELQECNALLCDNLRLESVELEARYYKFGGVPRFIYDDSQVEQTFQLDVCIQSGGTDVVQYLKTHKSVSDSDCGYRLVHMGPATPSFTVRGRVQFLSEQIADRVITKMSGDSRYNLSLMVNRRYQSFTFDYENSAMIYRLLVHYWFASQWSLAMKMTSLRENGSSIELKTEGKMTRVEVTAVDEIRLVANQVTYYRPLSLAFGAVDAIIVDGFRRESYGFHATSSPQSGAQPTEVTKLITQLAAVGVPPTSFRFCFVAPRETCDAFKSQTAAAAFDGGVLGTVALYVANVDATAAATA